MFFGKEFSVMDRRNILPLALSTHSEFSGGIKGLKF